MLADDKEEKDYEKDIRIIPGRRDGGIPYRL